MRIGDDDERSSLPRIRRGTERPSGVQDELAGKAKYPRTLRLCDRGVECNLRYRRSRWSDALMEDTGATYRNLFCWIDMSKQHVGALKFVEFKAAPYMDNFAFFDALDGMSQADCSLAEVVCAGWSDVVQDVLALGPILEFRLARR
jgi:hypothetical protein